MVDSYMVYGCDACGQGFRMYLEVGLEGINDGPKHKPVPFVIMCPFCGEPDCKDIFFRKFPLDAPKRAGGIPYFANIAGDECGCPTDMRYAVPEFRRSDPGTIRKGGAL